MKRCLAYALIAIALTLNAQAKDKEKYKDKYENIYEGPVAAVPDNGSTGVLLGVGLLALAIASRHRFVAR
jgi:hypothetical protein